jgi:hypothetical protein
MERDINTLVMMAIQIMAMDVVINVKYKTDGAAQEELQRVKVYV